MKKVYNYIAIDFDEVIAFWIQENKDKSIDIHQMFYNDLHILMNQGPGNKPEKIIVDYSYQRGFGDLSYNKSINDFRCYIGKTIYDDLVEYWKDKNK